MSKVAVNITIVNNLTGKEFTDEDILFSVKESTISVSIDPASTIGIEQNIFDVYDRMISWDFGDGTVIFGKTATHYYKKSGIYKISCIFFDKNSNSYVNENFRRIVVIDPIDNILMFSNSFVEANSYTKLKYQAGEVFLSADIIGTLSKEFSNVPINCYTKDTISKDITLLPKSSYSHLLRNHTFLDSESEPTIGILPEYSDIYLRIHGDDSAIMLDYYIIDIDYQNEINTTSLFNKITSLYDPELNKIRPSLTILSSAKNLPVGCSFVGSIGRVKFWYRDDTATEDIVLTYVYDQSYFENEYDNRLTEHTNLVSIGIKVDIESNNDVELSLYNSTCGLSSNTGDLLDLEGVNDNLYSMYRAKYLNIASPFVSRIVGIKNGTKYFVKDIEILSAEIIKSTITPVDSCYIEFDNTLHSEGTTYASQSATHGIIIPRLETKESEGEFAKFMLKVVAKRPNGEIVELTKEMGDFTFINLNNFINPESEYYLNPLQDYTNYSGVEFWDVHKTNTWVSDKEVLDSFVTAILDNDTFLQTVVNKGNNFTDDIANVSTCEVKNLISLYEMLNQNIDLFNGENFARPLSLSDLIKIFSINHSVLVGTKVKNPDEFEQFNGFDGKNKGRQYTLTEPIFVKKDGVNLWPKIIVYDKFAKTYRTVESHLLESMSEERSPLVRNEAGDVFFYIIDYFKDWGWELALGDLEYTEARVLSIDVYKTKGLPIKLSEDQHIRAREHIEKYYEFYEYIKTDDYHVTGAYLHPDTISERVKNFDTWTKTDGSIERLLYKELIKALSL